MCRGRAGREAAQLAFRHAPSLPGLSFPPCERDPTPPHAAAAGRRLPHGPAQELPEEEGHVVVRQREELHVGAHSPSVPLPGLRLPLVRVLPGRPQPGGEGTSGRVWSHRRRPSAGEEPGPAAPPALLPSPVVPTAPRTMSGFRNPAHEGSAHLPASQPSSPLPPCPSHSGRASCIPLHQCGGAGAPCRAPHLSSPGCLLLFLRGSAHHLQAALQDTWSCWRRSGRSTRWCRALWMHLCDSSIPPAPPPPPHGSSFFLQRLWL